MSQDPREVDLRIIQSLERGASPVSVAAQYKVSPLRVHFIALKQGLGRRLLIWGGLGALLFTAGYLTRRWIDRRRP